jgi:hypothetical protein
MDFDKFFKVAILVLSVLAILVYGMANRYQFFHLSGSLTGLACNHYTGKCEWLSPEEMGKDKIVKYTNQQREEMEKQGPTQAPMPDASRK